MILFFQLSVDVTIWTKCKNMARMFALQAFLQVLNKRIDFKEDVGKN